MTRSNVFLTKLGKVEEFGASIEFDPLDSCEVYWRAPSTVPWGYRSYRGDRGRYFGCSEKTKMEKNIEGLPDILTKEFWQKADCRTIRVYLRKYKNACIGNRDGITALDFAARWAKSPESIAVLLAQSGDIEPAILYEAALYSKTPAVKNFLIERGNQSADKRSKEKKNVSFKS